MARDVRTAPLELPRNSDAEQALLGSILYDPAVMAALPEHLEPRHFHEPFHQRLFARMRISFRSGAPINPIIFANAMANDPAFEELGGMRYLAGLIDAAPPSANTPGYALEVIQVGVRRHIIQVAAEMAERAMDMGEDPAQLLSDLGTAVAELSASGSPVQLTDFDQALDDVLDWIDNPGAHPEGILTGLGPLDEALGPLLPGDLMGLGGRPGMGKSAVAAIIGRNVAQAGHGVIELHAEMSVQQVTRRRLTATAYEMFYDQAPAYSAIRRRTVEFAQREMLGTARETLRGLPLSAVKRTGITLGRLRALVIHKKTQWERRGVKLGLLTIDHAGLITSDKEHRSRVDQQTEVSNGLKILAGDLNIVVLALLQLNRQLEARDDKRPTLGDFRDSGSWEQDVDFALGAYRPAYYAAKEKEPPQGKTAAQELVWQDWQARKMSPFIEMPLLKVREGDPSGTPRLWADMRTNTILGAEPQRFFGRDF